MQPRSLSEARFAEDSALGVRDAVRAERDVVRQKRAAAELAKAELTLRAPADGIVLSLPRSSGALVSPARGALFTIGSTLDELRLEASVAEADIGAVQPGQAARFSVPAYAEASFSARVERVLIEPERRQGAVSYRVRLVADNGEHRLLPGMSANVSIAIAEAKDVLCVREAALRFTPEDAEPAQPRTRVWTSPDGIRLAPIAVVAGISDGAYTQIEVAPGARLAPGDPVVIGTFPPEGEEGAGAGIRLGRRP
jgi:HlyD family secretion protein